MCKYLKQKYFKGTTILVYFFSVIRHLPLPFSFQYELFPVESHSLCVSLFMFTKCCFAFLKGQIAVQYEILINMKINTQGFLEIVISFTRFSMSPVFSWDTAITSPIKNNNQKYTDRNYSISHLPPESWKQL